MIGVSSACYCILTLSFRRKSLCGLTVNTAAVAADEVAIHWCLLYRKWQAVIQESRKIGVSKINVSWHCLQCCLFMSFDGFDIHRSTVINQPSLSVWVHISLCLSVLYPPSRPVLAPSHLKLVSSLFSSREWPDVGRIWLGRMGEPRNKWGWPSGQSFLYLPCLNKNRPDFCNAMKLPLLAYSLTWNDALWKSEVSLQEYSNTSLVNTLFVNTLFVVSCQINLCIFSWIFTISCQ